MSHPRDLDEQIARARQILRDAIAEYRPVAVFAGFSGGGDSMVSTHFAMGEVGHCTALHLNTGIGIEKTRAFARATAKDRGWSFHEERTGESFEDLVLGKVRTKDGTKQPYPGGFPGPPFHPTMYRRLKERPLNEVQRQAKGGRRRGCILVVTGIRGDESRVRSGYKRAVSKDPSYARIWVSPFYWATHDHFRAYRERFELPVNPVTTILGFSGECLCGSFADRGELLRIRMVEPETADHIEDLERRAEEAGFPWGYEDPGPPTWWKNQKKGQVVLFDHWLTKCGRAAGPDYRPMCHNCEKVKRVATPAEVAPCATSS